MALATSAVLAAAVLTGCAAAGEGTIGQSRVGDSLSPSMGGLPAGTPERPATPGSYPAVHDMPPPRNDAVLSEDQQSKLQQDLTALRDRQEKQTGTEPKPPAKKPAAKPKSADKPAAGATTSQAQ